MKLSGVRLRNYTSFEDSRWLDISDELTILIGKNGAGKSSLLRAIALLAGQQWPVPSDAQPVWGDVTPRLMMRFSVTEDERLSILRAAKIDDDANLRAFASGIEIDVSKSTYGVTSINRKFKSRRLEKLDAPAREATLAKVLEAHAAFTAIAGGRYKARIDAKSTWVDVHTASNQAIALISQQTSADFDKAAKALESAYKKHYEVHSFLRLRDEIAKRIPSRILMERASLPPTFEVEAVKAKQHRIFAHVCEIFDVEPEALLKLPVAARRNRAAQISRDLTEIVRALWSQDAIEIHFDCVGNMLTLAVTIDGRYYNYDQLSSGTAWFVSFLLQVAALEVGDDRDAVILIDEPGQYIHPVAQQRIYERLSELSKSMQVIYSTHSPYLFSRARLDQIRPIVKTQRSVVENSIFCTSDAETLTPILDVLGFPALGAFGVARERNVICEGPSDYFYLSAMHRIMKRTDDLSFIPCAGASRTQHLVSILHGWNLPYLVVIDRDREGERLARYLERFGVHRVVFVSVRAGEEVEDLFSAEDFRKHVLGELDVHARDARNGDIVAGLPGGKRAFARRFADRADQIVLDALSEATVAAFQDLFERVVAEFVRT